MHLRALERMLEAQEERERRYGVAYDEYDELEREFELADRIAEHASVPPGDPGCRALARKRLGLPGSPQRLFPVWALIGPGLAEPGHIELRSRTVYLDSDELLGPHDAIVAGALAQCAILRTYGVAIHEVFHAKHTKL
jgi:hypothetical protein